MNILKINASLTPDQSSSMKLSNSFINQLKQNHTINVTQIDLSKDILSINSEWIGAAFTSEESRSTEQKEILKYSDELIDQLKQADHIIIATPMYNFNVPSNLKSYFDLIARVGVTFRYTETGPIGLITDKQITVIVTTGGSEIGSSNDFMTPYIKQMMNFIGLNNLTIIASDKQSIDAKAAYKKANDQLNKLAQA